MSENVSEALHAAVEWLHYPGDRLEAWQQQRQATRDVESMARNAERNIVTETAIANHKYVTNFVGELPVAERIEPSAGVAHRFSRLSAAEQQFAQTVTLTVMDSPYYVVGHNAAGQGLLLARPTILRQDNYPLPVRVYRVSRSRPDQALRPRRLKELEFGDLDATTMADYRVASHLDMLAGGFNRQAELDRATQALQREITAVHARNIGRIAGIAAGASTEPSASGSRRPSPQPERPRPRPQPNA